MFERLAECNINIRMIASSEIKISVIIAKQDADRAVAAVHEAFSISGVGRGGRRQKRQGKFYSFHLFLSKEIVYNLRWHGPDGPRRPFLNSKRAAQAGRAAREEVAVCQKKSTAWPRGRETAAEAKLAPRRPTRLGSARRAAGRTDAGSAHRTGGGTGAGSARGAEAEQPQEAPAGGGRAGTGSARRAADGTKAQEMPTEPQAEQAQGSARRAAGREPSEAPAEPQDGTSAGNAYRAAGRAGTGNARGTAGRAVTGSARGAAGRTGTGSARGRRPEQAGSARGAAGGTGAGSTRGAGGRAGTGSARRAAGETGAGKEEMARRVMQAVQAVPPARAAYAPFEKIAAAARGRGLTLRQTRWAGSGACPCSPQPSRPCRRPRPPRTRPRGGRPAAPKARRKAGLCLAACLVAARPALPPEHAVCSPAGGAGQQPCARQHAPTHAGPGRPGGPGCGACFLANTQNPLPDGYEPPQLTTIDAAGRQVDPALRTPCSR